MTDTTENLDKLSLSENNSKTANSVNLANNSAPKTPVSLLQELYVRKGITPKYDLVQIEGAVHEPTFKYRVSVGELIATGDIFFWKEQKRRLVEFTDPIFPEIWNKRALQLFPLIKMFLRDM